MYTLKPDLLGSLSRDVYPDITGQFGCGVIKKNSDLQCVGVLVEGGGGGGAVGKTMGVAEGCDSPLQWEVGGLSDNLNKATTLDKKYAQTPRIVFFPKTLSFHEHIITYTSPILQKLA